jgi:hypothetical protein
MNPIKCRFRVDSILRALIGRVTGTKYAEVEVRTLKAAPIFTADPAHENSRHWSAAPTGTLELGGVNPESLLGLDPGDEIQIEITLIKKSPTAQVRTNEAPPKPPEPPPEPPKPKERKK